MKYEVGGIGAVNPTPYNPDGSINEEEYRRHVRWLVDCGVRFLQPSAATGQSMQMSKDEFRHLLELTVDEVGNRAFVTAYAGRPDPRETIDLVNTAKMAGAHSAFIIQPFFSIPDQEGIYLYYTTVARHTDLPLVIYNNPSRSGVNLSVDTIDRITDKVPNYVGLKQSEIEQFPQSVQRLSGKLQVMPKSEHHILFGLTLGSPGVLTFAANIIPDKVVKILNSWREGDFDTARQTYLEWLPLFDAIHTEPVPNALHYMLNRLGWNFGEPRIPAHLPSEASRRVLDAALEKLGLLRAATRSGQRA